MPNASARRKPPEPGAVTATPRSPYAAERQRLRGLEAALRFRHVVYQVVRGFFAARDFLEVQTPVRIRAPALEDYIDAEPAGDLFLRTSPELHMKRLLAAGYARIYQLGPCHRQGERGRSHLPEFTMLEWYRLNADCRHLQRDTVDLIAAVATAALGRLDCRFRGRTVSLAAPWEEATMDELFRRHAGLDLDAAVAAGEFERVLVEKIEPHLGLTRPTVVSGYPLVCSGLARQMPDRPTRAERWEVYIAGLELANACVELVDAREQRRRFAASAALRRAQGRPVYPLDEAFLAALDEGMPPAAGIAVGVDRLLMVLAGADTIDQVVAFSE